MKQVLLSIEEKQSASLISFLQSLDFVSVSIISEIPETQKAEAERRMNLIDTGEMKLRSWDEASEVLFPK